MGKGKIKGGSPAPAPPGDLHEVVGLDPGRHTGHAVYHVAEDRLASVKTLDFWQVVEDATHRDPRHTLYVVERPDLNRPTFFHGQTSPRKREKISRNVGANMREATLLIEHLKSRGFVVVEVRPSQTKWSADLFRQITGFAKRTSEHGRDAGRLCFGVRAWPSHLRYQG